MLSNLGFSFKKSTYIDFKQYIRPSNGFNSSTPQPDPIGTEGDFGIDSKVIARWDVVPFQTFYGVFEIGIVAFHINGIDRVDFSVEGGSWVSVKKMTINTITGILEYCISLDSTDFDDGPIEIRAIVYPNVGIPRVFASSMNSTEGIEKGEHSLFINVNSNHTLPEITKYVSNTGNDTTGNGSESFPYLSILKAAKEIQNSSGQGNADGGIIYLKAGEYTLGTYSFALLTTTTNRWITIQPAPGVSKEEVIIVSADDNGLRTKLVHLKSLTVAPNSVADQLIINSNGPEEDYFWIDNCNFIGPGQNQDGQWVYGISAIYITDSEVSLCRDSISGAITRNVQVTNIGSDAFSGEGLIVNCTVNGINALGADFHSDVLQFYDTTTIENVIAYEIISNSEEGQGFFAGDNISIKDIAFVNCQVNNQLVSNVARVFQFGGPTDNLYVKNCSFTGSSNWREDFHFTANNIVIKDTYFSILPDPYEVAGITYINITTD